MFPDLLLTVALFLWFDLILYLLFVQLDDSFWTQIIPGSGFWYASRFGIARYCSRA